MEVGIFSYICIMFIDVFKHKLFNTVKAGQQVSCAFLTFQNT